MLGLAIGANTAIFSLLNALVLRDLPVREPDSLMHVSTTTGTRGESGREYARNGQRRTSASRKRTMGPRGDLLSSRQVLDSRKVSPTRRPACPLTLSGRSAATLVRAEVRETSQQREFAPHVFVPEAQLPLASRGWFQTPRITMTYLVRTATDPLPLVDQFRSAVAEVYRSQPIYNITTIEEAMSAELVSWRQYLMLLGAFAAIAAALALVGVYGLVAYAVGQRTNEIGIRRALGAHAGAVLRLVLRQGVILTGIGVGVGVTASLAATRLLAGLLWGVSPTDPATFVLVAVGLVAAALLACYVPARRALAIDPIVALRTE